MNTMEHLRDCELENVVVGDINRNRILDDHCTDEYREETIGMTYSQLYAWLGY